MTTYTRVGEHVGLDPVEAVADLARQIHQPDMAGVLFYCSSDYDLPALAAALNATFRTSVQAPISLGDRPGPISNKVRRLREIDQDTGGTPCGHRVAESILWAGSVAGHLREAP